MNANTNQSSTPAPVFGKSGKKICCSCPETKKVRDECVVTKGPENCAAEIEAHKVCLRAEGFRVD
jgi:cytochrome c oxidase assembly protein subunit 17